MFMISLKPTTMTSGHIYLILSTRHALIQIQDVEFIWHAIKGSIHTFSLRKSILELQDGDDLGMSWPLPSGLASIPLSTLNEHFRF